MCWIQLIALISVKYFNQIFKTIKKPGNAAIQTLNTVLASNDENKKFWGDEVSQLSQNYFTCQKLRKNIDWSLIRKEISPNALLLSIQFNLGIQLRQKIYNYDSSSTFTLQDIQTLDLIFLSRILQLSITMRQTINSFNNSQAYSNLNEFSSQNLDKNYMSSSLRTDTIVNRSFNPKLDLNPLQLLNLNNEQRKMEEHVIDFTTQTQSNNESIDQTLSELMSCISEKVTEIERKQKQKQAKKSSLSKFKCVCQSNNSLQSYTQQFLFNQEFYGLISCAQLNFHQRAKSGLLLYKFAVAFLNLGKLNQAFMCCQKYLIEQRVDSVTALINSIKMVLQFRKGDLVAANSLYKIAKNQIIYQFGKEKGDHPLQVFVDMMLADCYYSRGNLLEASKYYQSAYKIAKESFGDNLRVQKCRQRYENTEQKIKQQRDKKKL